eukprot:jgi/Chrzof1/8179/Cz03g00190.t1
MHRLAQPAEHLRLTSAGQDGLNKLQDGKGILTDDAITFLVEAAWLAYEEPKVMQTVIDHNWLSLTPQHKEHGNGFVAAFDFTSITYQEEWVEHSGLVRTQIGAATECAGHDVPCWQRCGAGISWQPAR